MQKILVLWVEAELGSVPSKIAGNYRVLLFRARGLSVTELQLVIVDHLPTRFFQDDCTVAVQQAKI